MAEQQTAATGGKTAWTREYETIYLTKADLTTEALDKIKDRVKGLVEREGGRVIKVTTWGKKKTAFPILKPPRAIFVHVSYLGGGAAVAEVERNLRNIEEVTKFQTIKISDQVNPESRPTEADVVLEGDREEERPPRELREGGVEGEGPVEAEAAADEPVEAEEKE